MAIINGNNSNNVINGSSQNDTIIAYGGDDIVHGNAGNDTINGWSGNDTLYGDEGNDTLNGGGNNDSIHGGIGDDILYDDYGNDAIYADEGNDILACGVGNDLLFGGSGDDTYNYNTGDGQDIISDSSGTDTIKFGTGITENDLEFSISNFASGHYDFTSNAFVDGHFDLNIARKNSSDKITVKDWNLHSIYFPYGDSYQIENFTFSDGSSISAADIANMLTIPAIIQNNNIQFASGINQNDLLLYEYYNVHDDGSTTSLHPAVEIMLKNSTGYLELGEDAYNYTLEFSDGTITTVNNLLPVNINGTSSNDYLTGNHKSNIINGLEGDDTIIDNIGGNDTIYGGNGNDSLNLMGEGNYQVYGQDGDDNINIVGFYGYKTYPQWPFEWGSPSSNGEYAVSYVDGGSGNDTISLKGGQNTIYGGLNSDMITTDTITVDDGVIAAGDDFIDGGAGNDVITDKGSGDNGDTFIAGMGNDTIYAYEDAGYIDAEGNFITTGNSNDTYIFNNGDAQDTFTDFAGIDDTIRFGSGIAKSNLRFSRNGDNVIISFNNSSDKITVNNWYTQNNPYNYKIESLKFSDGSSMTATEIENIIAGTIPNPTIVGTDGYQYISGQNGNDVYYLKRSNDRVMDYLGNDSYIFYRGDGQDNITDQSGNDTIYFGSGITKSSISFERQDINLIMKINDADNINVNKWYRNSNYEIEKVQFTDGSYYTNSEINQIIQQISSYSSNSDAIVTSIDESASIQQQIPLVYGTT
jgi:Ca2+-binding RTX toxin-like protein